MGEAPEVAQAERPPPVFGIKEDADTTSTCSGSQRGGRPPTTRPGTGGISIQLGRQQREKQTVAIQRGEGTSYRPDMQIGTTLTTRRHTRLLDQ